MKEELREPHAIHPALFGRLGLCPEWGTSICIPDWRVYRKGVSMISIVTVQNFKNLRDITVDLEPLTVFVGANGSGKTSVLDAVNYASLAATGAPEKVFTGNRHCDYASQ